jgi:phosphoribosylformimino-5-aminoimidazole carboxamide ribotide isomerase
VKIFPAIDIKDKKCVRLVKGNFDNKTEYQMSPVEQAGKYIDYGFKNLHIVDLDGELTGETVNLEIINAHMYFVHSYEFIPEDKNVISSITDYSSKIVCSVEKQNIFGTQFHPEKSDREGLKLIENFINL